FHWKTSMIDHSSPKRLSLPENDRGLHARVRGEGEDVALAVHVLGMARQHHHLPRWNIVDDHIAPRIRGQEASLPRNDVPEGNRGNGTQHHSEFPSGD